MYLSNSIFGIIAGFWLLILGLAIIVTGLQIQSGITVSIVSNVTTNISYSYSDVTLPFSTYSFVWGIIIMCISIYIIFKNAEDLV